MSLPEHIQKLVAREAIFIVNHSGGKDSQAMFHFIHAYVPRNQIVNVHAILPKVEWEGVEEHVRNTTLGTPVYTCQSRRTLLEMIEERGMFPSPSQRQCTSDLKRGPIEKTIRHILKDDWHNKLVVNCMGMRAQESTSRQKLETFKFSTRNSKAGREWYDWLPIHDWKVERVFSMIKAVGQEPHWAYAAGMSRLSCCFCIMSNKQDLTTAARLNPSLYKTYVELERSTGQVMLMPSKSKGRQTLEQVTGVYI
jgi:DNA sulfur modification protein DndC